MAEKVKVNCPNCHVILEVRASANRLKGQCPSCKQAIQVDVEFSTSNSHQPKENTSFNIFEQFKLFDYSLLRPVENIFSSSFYKKKMIQWLLGFGLFPLLLTFLINFFSLDLVRVAWLLGAYFCFYWVSFFSTLLKPSTEAYRTGFQWAVFTMFFGVLILTAFQYFPFISTLYKLTESKNFAERAMGFTLGVGVCEETCKALPLLIFGLKRPDLLTPRNAIYLGILSGLGFALAEIVQYTFIYWNLEVPVEHSLVFQITRFLTLPLLHASWAGVTGFFIALSLLNRKKGKAFIVVGIALTAIAHGVYDIFSGGLLGIATASASIILLMGYIFESEAIAQKVQRQT